MKITLEFEHSHELTALLVELASKIEQPEACCDADYLKSCQDGYEWMKKMINDNGVVKINKPLRYPAMYTQFDETPISHDHTKDSKWRK